MRRSQQSEELTVLYCTYLLCLVDVPFGVPHIRHLKLLALLIRVQNGHCHSNLSISSQLRACAVTLIVVFKIFDVNLFNMHVGLETHNKRSRLHRVVY